MRAVNRETALICVDLLLLLGAVLRVTRLVVADDLGLWWIKDPLDQWAHRNHGSVTPWWHRYLGGLSCPFCVGFWIGCTALLLLYLVGGPGHAPEWWRYLTGAFALNWVTAHLGVRAGDTAD